MEVEGCLQHIVSVTNADESTSEKYDCAFKTNPMSSIVVGWEELQKLINNHVHYKKQLETSLPPPPPPPPSSQGTPTHVDSIVDMSSPTIETLANGEKVLGNLSDSTKQQLQQMRLDTVAKWQNSSGFHARLCERAVRQCCYVSSSCGQETSVGPARW